MVYVLASQFCLENLIKHPRLLKKGQRCFKMVKKAKTVVKRGIPEAAMERLMKKAGADRVGEDAKAALRDVLEEFGEEVARKASQFAKHAGRCTIKAGDIKLASKDF